MFWGSPGCNNDANRAPALPNGPPNATSSGSGTGGAGGATAPNICECLSQAAMADAGADAGATSCGGCLTHAFETGQSCETVAMDCQADAGCLQILSCVSACGGDVTCTKACMLPFDADTSHTLFQKKMACACGSCADTCAATTPIACTSGAAGAGGTGGTGGVGGTSGTGGAPPNCACVLSFSNTMCSDCANVAVGDTCNTVHTACLNNMDCKGISECVGSTTAPCATASCIEACFAANRPGVSLYNSYTDCVCTQCASQCMASGDCPP